VGTKSEILVLAYVNEFERERVSVIVCVCEVVLLVVC